MKVVEVNNYKDFMSLKNAWEDVFLRCNNGIFSAWEWLSTWWKHFGSDKKLMLLLAEDDGSVVGIAPLMYSVHKMFGLRQGKIEFVGTPDTDYNNFILVDKDEECVELFIEHLKKINEKWNCVELMDLPENARCLPFLQKFSRNIKPIHECPYTLLPDSYDEFLMGLTRNQRKNVYRTSRRLEEAFKVEFVDDSGPESFYKGMLSLFDLHEKRWESRGFPGIFADERQRAFNLDIAQSFSDKKWLCLFLLRVSGKPVAAAYGFKYQSKFYEYITGFDPMYIKYNVGNLLRAHMVRCLISEGIKEFDFMRGAEEYKDRWHTRVRRNQVAIIPRGDFLGGAMNRLYQEYWHQGNRVKYLLNIK